MALGEHSSQSENTCMLFSDQRNIHCLDV